MSAALLAEVERLRAEIVALRRDRGLQQARRKFNRARAEAAEAALLAKSAAYDALVAGIDLNDHVMVKLNAHGLAILKAQHDALRAAVPSVREWTPPNVDADGFSKHQLWCLFQDFGPHISLPARKPFDAMRLLVSDDRPSHTAGDGNG